MALKTAHVLKLIQRRKSSAAPTMRAPTPPRPQLTPPHIDMPTLSGHPSPSFAGGTHVVPPPSGSIPTPGDIALDATHQYMNRPPVMKPPIPMSPAIKPVPPVKVGGASVRNQPQFDSDFLRSMVRLAKQSNVLTQNIEPLTQLGSPDSGWSTPAKLSLLAALGLAPMIPTAAGAGIGGLVGGRRGAITGGGVGLGATLGGGLAGAINPAVALPGAVAGGIGGGLLGRHLAPEKSPKPEKRDKKSAGDERKIDENYNPIPETPKEGPFLDWLSRADSKVRRALPALLSTAAPIAGGAGVGALLGGTRGAYTGGGAGMGWNLGKSVGNVLDPGLQIPGGIAGAVGGGLLGRYLGKEDKPQPAPVSPRSEWENQIIARGLKPENSDPSMTAEQNAKLHEIIMFLAANSGEIQRIENEKKRPAKRV